MPGAREWGRIGAGVVTGLAVAIVAIGLWIMQAGGGASTNGALRMSGDRADGQDGPIIGAFLRTVADRLESTALPATPLRGPLRFRATGVRVAAPGRDFLNATLVTGALDAEAFRGGAIVVSDLEVTRPDLVMIQRADGTWNYETPLAPLLEEDGAAGDESERRFVVTGARVVDGTAVIELPDRTVTAADVDLDLSAIAVAGPGVAAPRMRVDEGTALVTGLIESPPDTAIPVRVADAVLRFPDATVEFDAGTLALGENRFTEVTGVWTPGGEGFGIAATGGAVDLELANVRFLAPERLPEEGTASFRFSIQPAAGDATRIGLSDLTVVSGDSRIAGSLTLVSGPGTFALPAADLTVDQVSAALLERVTGQELPFQGSVTGAVRGEEGDIRFDLVGRFAGEPDGVPFSTELEGRIEFGADGVELRGLTATLDSVPLAAVEPWLPLPLSGVATGRVSLSGAPGRAPLAVDVGLDVAAGRLLVDGTVDLTGVVPAYDLAGSLIGIEADQLIGPRVPPVSVSAHFTLVGRGTEPATMRATLGMAGRFTGWESDARDTIDVALRVADGRVAVQALTLRLASLEAAAEGELRFVEPRTGEVRYRAAVDDLGPWGPWLPVIGDTAAVGTLVAQGTVAGTENALRLGGEFTAESVVSGEWQIGTLEATYTATTGDAFSISARGEAADIVTPTAGEFSTATFDVSLARPVVNASLQAEARDGRMVRFVADGRVPAEGPAEVILRELRLDLAGGQWTLAQPATVTWTDAGRYTVAELRLEDALGAGRVSVDGVVWPLAEAAATFEIADLPVGEVQRLVGRRAVVTGRLAASGEVRGPGDAPIVDVVFALAEGTIDGVEVRQIDGAIAYADRILTAHASAHLGEADTTEVFELRTRLPVAATLDTSPDIRLLDGGAVEGELVARSVSLAPFAALSPQVRDLTGLVNGRITLGGTVEAPDLGGRLTVQDGSLRVIPLNQQFTAINGSFDLDDRRVVVRDLRVQSGGTATLTGELTFEPLSRPSFDLVAYLQTFRPMGVNDRTDAAVSGRVTFTGDLEQPVMSGSISVTDGWVVIPQFGAAPELEDFSAAGPVLGQDIAAAQSEGLMSRLIIRDLGVEVGTDVWFVAQEARAQLGGELTVDKGADDFRIQGTLRGQRGVYTLRAGPVVRRFEVTDAEVRFLGSPDVNPALSIAARRIVFDPETGRQLEIQVMVGGTLRNPTLALASADAANIPESELLSYLMFGRSTLELSGGGLPGEALLEATLAELASLELEAAIVGDLGFALDVFQVRFGPDGIGGGAAPTLVVGREVATDVFLTVESGLSALFDDNASSLNTWAIRLEWAFDRRSSARLSYEPVTRGRFLRGFGAALPVQNVAQQFFLELRRRWVY